jgi:hypothetical protein
VVGCRAVGSPFGKRMPRGEDATLEVPGNVLRGLVDAGSEDRPTPSGGTTFASPSSLEGVRVLYAAGQLEDAMALATEIAEQLAAPVPGPSSESDLSSLIDEIENAEPSMERGTPIPPALRSTVRFRNRPMTVEDALGEVPPESRAAVPRITMRPSEIAQLPLGPREGFVLAQIAAVGSVEELLDTSAMSPSETMEIVHHLVALGIVGLG